MSEGPATQLHGGRWSRLKDATARALQLETLLLLTLLTLVVTFTDSSFIRVPLTALTVLALVYRTFLADARYWSSWPSW